MTQSGRFRWTLTALAAGLAAVTGVSAQERWSWPEKAENLQQLPADFPAENLRSVMRGFSAALGVRCSHCHVGEPDASLSSYDFVSDDNPNKNTARKMLQLLGDVNTKLKEIEPSGPQRVNMWCHTCHRGRPRPMKLEEELTEVESRQGVDAAIAHYRTLRERYYGRGVYDFGESTLNGFGYTLLRNDRPDAAVAVFRLNAEVFPESGNVWDSLAEAYMASGRNELATIYYRKSIEIDPDNANALGKLRELTGPGGP